MRKLKTIDLFAGSGGFTFGLDKTGHYETVLFCEKDAHCISILKKNFGNDINLIEDVHELTVKHPQIPEGIVVDVICGGFPCQDISIGGQMKGIIKGNRSSLWRQYARIINEFGPSWAIIENVEKLRSNGLGVVLKDLHEIGYDCEWHIVEATHVGLPHRRERCIVIAHRRSLRLHERLGEERHLLYDKEWKSKTTDTEGDKCKPESFKVCQILSERAFEQFRATHPNRASTLSSVLRVTDGIPKGLDEENRKIRVKQMGNAVAPDIVSVIGERIAQLNNLLTTL